MGDPITIDLRHVARGLEVALRQVQTVVELLDEGNTVPFITRYRKDRTGGLDEEQVREIHSRLVKQRLLAERKQTILRSIESQGKLTDKLSKQIQSATTTKRLEDLYLPFKPKKQTLATLARSRGLEELASEILEAAPAATDLDRRAADFANPDRQVPTAADALLGAGHILAEQFSEQAELRQRLREVLQRTGKLASSRIGAEVKPAPAAEPGPASAAADASAVPPSTAAESVAPAEGTPVGGPGEPAQTATESPAAAPVPVAERAQDQLLLPSPEADNQPAASGAPPSLSDPPVDPPSTNSTDDQSGAGDVPPDEKPVDDDDAVGRLPLPEFPGSGEEPFSDPAEGGPPQVVTPESEGSPEKSAGETDGSTAPADQSAEPPLQPTVAEVVQPPAGEIAPPVGEPSAPVEPGSSAAPQAPAAPAPPKPARPPRQKQARAERKLTKKELKKKKAEEKKQKAFSDYFDYSEELRKIPPHRVLAINRGERAKVLRVRVDADVEAMIQVVDEVCVPPEHPHAEFLRGCARDALTRLILPALEREARRELTERAEQHAVEVFARNLRNLLLQPPVRDRRVLAVDPGFKSGCKLVALDQFGNVLDHGVIYLVGKPDRRDEARQFVVQLIDRYQIGVIAIGNGTGCRECEDFFAALISGELQGRAAYVIVNEAGASVYSTSRLGREEFPNYDATLRGAISIGRRLQDPLSELVKIEPANIGVGLYQHDVKAKHLQTSLDEVVESCVNYVGVDLNTASPALLRYVSGLNQLTARRIYEHRLQHGPFRNRLQLRDVPGIGETTFVQAAGFLKIAGGDNPLDATWIHPESYEIASRVMARLDFSPGDLSGRNGGGKPAELEAANKEALAAELQIGTLLLNDILAQFARPGRDPREDLPAPVFKQGIIKIEDLSPGMELTGTVLNVVDFGAFVDIGMHDSGLVHVSQLADRFIRDPHDVVAVGDIVRVWVKEVDKQRRRVSLTMIPPGRQRTGQRRPDRPPARAAESSSPEAAPESAGRPPAQRPPRPQREGRPPQREGRPHGRGGPPRGKPDRPPRPQEFRPKPRPPKPVTPITDEMKTGKAPMRSFSDLAQFFQVKKEDAPDPRKKPKPDERKSDKPAPPPAPPASEAPPPAEPPPPESSGGPPPGEPGSV